MKVVKPFYKSKRWKHKRTVILKQSNYLCAESARYGKSLPADTVHHIYPLENYPELALVEWNLVALNSKVHNTFHDRNTNQIIGAGIYWQKKFKKEFEKFYGCPPPNESF